MPNNNPTGKNQYSNRNRTPSQQPGSGQGSPYDRQQNQRIPDSD